jgi:hypothetical protein
VRCQLSEPFGTATETFRGDDGGLGRLGVGEHKALGLRIEKCVDEVLRSHLVERPLNTTKNYIPKQEGMEGKSKPRLFSP